MENIIESDQTDCKQSLRIGKIRALNGYAVHFRAAILNHSFVSVLTGEYGPLPSFEVQVDNNAYRVIIILQRVNQLLKYEITSKSSFHWT